MQSGHRGIAYTCALDTQLTISRTSDKDIQQRQLVVKLDDEPFATLMYGESAARAVEPGRHRLSVDNTWVWKNVDFNVEPGAHAKFLLINRSGRFTWFLIGMIGAGPMYITIEREL